MRTRREILNSSAHGFAGLAASLMLFDQESAASQGNSTDGVVDVLHSSGTG